LVQDRLRQRATGTTVLGIKQRELRQVLVPLPPLQIQRKIGAIIAAYDDLIENNNRRIKLLEETAQRIYDEWFVDFRYPGHEHVPLIESELGLIPQGWSVRSLVDVVSQSRSSLNPGEFPTETFAHYSIPSFDDGRRPRMEEGAKIKSTKFVVGTACVLYSKLNPRIPRVWMVTPSPEVRAVSSTELLVLTARRDWPLSMVYALLGSEQFASRVAGLAGGTSTSHQRVKPGDLLALRILDPEPSLCRLFARTVDAMTTLAERLRKLCVVLQTTRDLLLPRLVSGEIDLAGLEILGPNLSP
jgi:type I restriction enzyme S subunit